MTTRPAPPRIAGYEPVPLEEDVGRVPTREIIEDAPPTPAPARPAYPPRRPVLVPPGAFSPFPPFLTAPPIIIPPGKPPCDPEKDPECPIEPPEPPVEVSEPSILYLLGASAIVLAAGGFRRSRRRRHII